MKQGHSATPSKAKKAWFLPISLLALVLSLAAGISFGAADIGWATAWKAVFRYEGISEGERIIRELRLPRELGAAIVGASFAVSGAIMQGMTKNPLADSGLLGLNAGASFAIAAFYAAFSDFSYWAVMLVSFAGAGLGAFLVFGIGALSKNGLSPIRMTLAGAAVSALLTALGEGIALYYQLSQDLAFWIAGGVSGTTWTQLKILFPVMTGALLLAFSLARPLTILHLGDEAAKGLGLNTFFIKTVLILIVFVLAGIAVSVVGPVAFVGLMIPHIARFFVGQDYRWVLPGSAILGGTFMVLADTAARLINAPYETPIGAVVSFIGVPFFLYLARKGGREFA
ncbi:iron ABC transporter permease [Caldibacillus debilis]|uniref:FecCD family ABC transporter permease n=1 Tax=Caldibacillus debilis TaxID=301148 RepID=UPI002FDA2EDD